MAHINRLAFALQMSTNLTGARLARQGNVAARRPGGGGALEEGRPIARARARGLHTDAWAGRLGGALIVLCPLVGMIPSESQRTSAAAAPAAAKADDCTARATHCRLWPRRACCSIPAAGLAGVRNGKRLLRYGQRNGELFARSSAKLCAAL